MINFPNIYQSFYEAFISKIPYFLEGNDLLKNINTKLDITAGNYNQGTGEITLTTATALTDKQQKAPLFLYGAKLRNTITTAEVVEQYCLHQLSIATSKTLTVGSNTNDTIITLTGFTPAEYNGDYKIKSSDGSKLILKPVNKRQFQDTIITQIGYIEVEPMPTIVNTLIENYTIIGNDIVYTNNNTNWEYDFSSAKLIVVDGIHFFDCVGGIVNQPYYIRIMPSLNYISTSRSANVNAMSSDIVSNASQTNRSNFSQNVFAFIVELVLSQSQNITYYTYTNAIEYFFNILLTAGLTTTNTQTDGYFLRETYYAPQNLEIDTTKNGRISASYSVALVRELDVQQLLSTFNSQYKYNFVQANINICPDKSNENDPYVVNLNQ